MILCVDVGNTTITFGEYINGVLSFKTSLHYDYKFTKTDIVDYLIKELPCSKTIDEVEGIIMSSVVPAINAPLVDALNDLFEKEVQTIDLRTTKVGFDFNIDNPLETGGDLICDLAGAYKKYGYPLLIADLGTASKLLYFDKKGRFSSANILPGIKLCRNSLSKDTSLLPRIELKVPETIIAKNTVDAMNTGLMFGHVDMVEGMLNRYRKELKMDIKVVVTGGNMNKVKTLMNPEYIFDDDLTLDGLYTIYTLNRKH